MNVWQVGDTRITSVVELEAPIPGEMFIPAASAGAVAEHYATLYPELTTCSIEGPELKGKRRVYTFVRRIGTKG